jgi:hypothetical protein
MIAKSRSALALSPDMIDLKQNVPGACNIQAGAGKIPFICFDLAGGANLNGSEILIGGRGGQLDSYAYLFTKPTFISLDPNASVSNIAIKGVRIGVNGAEAKVGQTYIPLSATVGGSNYTAAAGQLMSSVGAVVALEKGPVADEFFLSFEQIGTNSKTYNDPSIAAVQLPAPAPAPDYGVRTFDELNASMSTLTGVPITNAQVAPTFASVKQAMPSVENIDAFLASHQTGVAQLAIAYCSAMVDGGKFFNLSFNGNRPGSAIDASTRNALEAQLADVVGDLTTQPTQTELFDVVDPLLQRTATSQAGNAKGAGIAAKAACAAVLGSAAITVQ